MKNYISKIFFFTKFNKTIKTSDIFQLCQKENIIGSYLLEFQDGLDKYILRDDLGTKNFFTV